MGDAKAVTSPEALAKAFSVPGLTFESAPGRLVSARLKSRYGEVAVGLNGAHVLDYRTAAGESVLWMSQHSNLEPGKAIRGGVPLCWPWFGPVAGDPTKPSHGFARTSTWRLVQADESSLTLQLGHEDASFNGWPFEFDLSYRVSLDEAGLHLAMTAVNLSWQPMTMSGALHTYFAIERLSDTRVHGLDGVVYWDQLDGLAAKRQEGPVLFDREVDRIYVDAPRTTTIEGASCGRRIQIESTGSESTVVWNPWISKAQRMPDFGDEEYLEMICVETANAGPDRVELAPEASHTLGASIRVG